MSSGHGPRRTFNAGGGGDGSGSGGGVVVVVGCWWGYGASEVTNAKQRM